MDKTMNLQIKDGQFVILEMKPPCRRQIIAVNKIMADWNFDYYDYLQSQVKVFNKMKSLGLNDDSDFSDGNEKALEFTSSTEFVAFKKLQDIFNSSEMTLEIVKHIWVEKGGRYSETLNKYGERISDYYGEDPDADVEGDLQSFFGLTQTATRARKKVKGAKNTTPDKE